MSEHTNGHAELVALAAQAAALSQERRREIERGLRFTGNPKQEAGFAAGLAQASEIVAHQSAEAGVLREAAAVAAARALYLEREYARLCEEVDSPAFRAQLEADAVLIRSGEMQGIPAEDVIQEMKDREKKARE